MRDFTPSTGADVLNGSIGNDLFEAFVVQNANGEQTNQLATGDRMNGGAGTDTLSANVIAASALNAGPSMAISPKTVGVENVAFTALTTSVSTVSNTETVEINAKFMNGLNHIGSVHSDASVLITNVNTLKNDGIYANKRNTEALTVRMDHSGNDAVTAESDLTVLLDNDYLLSGATTLSEALYWLLDEKAELALINGTAATGTGRLAKIDTNGLMFTIDGKAYTLQSEAARLAGTHAGFVAELKKQLALDIAAGKIPAGVELNLDNSRTDTTGLDDGQISNAIPALVLSVTSGEIKPTGFAKPADLTGQYDVYGIFDNAFDGQNLPIAINVELEKVGRGSDGGDLTIGGMATDLQNEWDFSSSATLKEGIEKFNITVSGDASQFSSLASLQSTNNTLQTVNVSSAAGSKADLIIGNHNTEGAITNALKDVREFNSSTFANNVTVNASVTDESVAKYMNLKDGAPAAPDADNANFAYTFGAGNDTLNMNISKANLAVTGSTVREDFSLTVNTAAGNDNVTVQIGDGVAVGTEAWYTNSALNKNLTINTGEGNDTVYSDNSGQKAVWVFNTPNQDALAVRFQELLDAVPAAEKALADAKAALAAAPTDAALITAVETAEGELTYAQAAVTEDSDYPAFMARQLDDLVSDGSESYALFKANLTVTFRGLTKTVTIDSNATTYKSSDLQINQAIKKAINEDGVLNKLLVAKDGPANTLVVTSLIDGSDVVTDLDVDVAAPQTGTLTSAEISAYAAAHNLSPVSESAVLTAIGGAVTAFKTEGDYEPAFASTKSTAVVTGSDSDNAADSTHNLGAGDDVLVLSTNHDNVTDATTNATSSNETIVYNANELFGKDVIVNFNAFGTPSSPDATPIELSAGEDVLDFTALGGKKAGFNNAVNDTDGLIKVQAIVSGTNDTFALIKGLFADNTTANKGIYVAVDTANVGTVYQIVDGTGSSDLTVTEIGKIDLADTAWTALTADNFA